MYRFFLTLLVLPILRPETAPAEIRKQSYATPAYVEFNTGAYNIAENQTNAVITLIRTGDYRIPASVQYRTEPGSATPELDYQHVEGTVYFPAGTGIQTFVVPVFRDRAVESDETVILKLFGPDVNTVIIRDTAVLTISDVRGKSGTPNGLKINVVTPTQVVISWPDSGVDFILERSPALTSDSWEIMNHPRSLSDGYWTVTEPNTNHHYFYRLREP